MLGYGKHRFRGSCQAIVGAILLTASSGSVRAQVDPNALAESARNAMAERRFSEAAEIYSDLAAKFPNEPTLQANLGMALHFSNRDTEAIAPLQEAALAMPSSFPAHFALGASLSRLGRYAEAVASLRKSTQIDPQHPFAHALLGEALEATEEYSQAATAWRALSGLDPTNPYPHAGLVRCNEELVAMAVEQLRQRDPESPYMLRFLGRTRLATAQYPSALYLFRTALERQPGVRAVHEAVASVYERAGQPEWAKIERLKAESLPATDCAESQSAECNFLAGRFDLAPALSGALSASDLFWAARSYASLAEQSFKELASLPESVEKLTLVADIFASQEQFSR
ncbi:MAG: tetratricopeptide repeat protein, partial [Bryobacterales bacterium]|nr:tetratricopeptide repeat protein [Bryobacterales bacterium]